MPDDATGSPLTGSASLIGQAFEHVYRRLAPDRAAERMGHIAELLEAHEQDFRALIPPVFGALAEHPDFPQEAQAVFRTLAEPEHFAQASILLVGIYPIVSGFVQAAIAPFTNDVAQLAWAAHPRNTLSPAELALGKVRNTLGGVDFYAEGATSGYDQTRMDVLYLNTGEPPGLMQLLELYRRDLLDEAGLEKGVAQSRIRPEWLQAIKDLRFAPPSPGEVISGSVKGHLDDGPARKLFEESGINPDHYDWMHATAGRPPGAQGLLGLLNRGLISEEDFGEAIRQSDIQNRWIPALLAERRYIPPPRSIVPMLRSEAITEKYARQLMEWHGIIPEDQDIYIAEAHSHKQLAQKELSLAQIRQVYTAGIISRDQAHDDIVALGYADALAGEILALEDNKLVAKFKNAAITHLHSMFLKHRITQSDASNELDALGIQATIRDHLIPLWVIERDSVVTSLTLSQIQGAWRRNAISDDQFASFAGKLGYLPDDIYILKFLAFPPTAFPQERTPADIFGIPLG